MVQDRSADWDISRDAPYFGFEIPDAPGKYFYVWFDAPIGYLGSSRRWAKRGLDFDEYLKAGQHHRAAPLHRQGHQLLPQPVLAGGVAWRGLQQAHRVHVHGFLTVDGEKMSKSRGTFITARQYLDLLPAEPLRYYFAAKLGTGSKTWICRWTISPPA